MNIALLLTTYKCISKIAAIMLEIPSVTVTQNLAQHLAIESDNTLSTYLSTLIYYLQQAFERPTV